MCLCIYGLTFVQINSNKIRNADRFIKISIVLHEHALADERWRIKWTLISAKIFQMRK